jgi:hypothetical protein
MSRLRSAWLFRARPVASPAPWPGGSLQPSPRSLDLTEIHGSAFRSTTASACKDSTSLTARSTSARTSASAGGRHALTVSAAACIMRSASACAAATTSSAAAFLAASAPILALLAMRAAFSAALAASVAASPAAPGLNCGTAGVSATEPGEDGIELGSQSRRMIGTDACGDCRIGSADGPESAQNLSYPYHWTFPAVCAARRDAQPVLSRAS